MLSGLPGDAYLQNLGFDDFVERLVHYYGELNTVHPFREGNGRTARAFLRQLSAAAGYLVDWSVLSEKENITACAENPRTADVGPLTRLLVPAVRRRLSLMGAR